ncbi:MAG: hypothetical protein IJO53_04870, partial [Clostridia bacterium]|nr:hypothetical protein [Clostridia bacterium]
MNKAAKRIWAFLMAVCMICTMCSAMGEIADCEHDWHTVATLREGTCETAGVYKDQCAECGEVKYVNKLGHKFEMDFVDATCEEPQMYGEVCSECGETNGEMTAVEGSEALGHKWNEKVLDASCENPAGVQRTCERCEEVEFISFDEGSDSYEAQKEHTPVEVDDVAATCKTKGWSGKIVCEACGYVIDEGNEIDIDTTAHKAVVTTVLKEGNCKTGTDGIGKMVCELCDEEMGYGTIPYEHAWVEDIKKAATCAEDGEMDRICALCELEEKGIVIPATGKHDYVETFIDATCTEPAMYGEICSVCEGVKGELKVVEDSEALGHKWVEKVIEADCTHAAGVLKTCSVCDEEEL